MFIFNCSDEKIQKEQDGIFFLTQNSNCECGFCSEKIISIAIHTKINLFINSRILFKQLKFNHFPTIL